MENVMNATTTHALIATLCDKARTAIREGLNTVDFDDYSESADEIIITHTTPCGTIELYCAINEPWQVDIDNTTTHTLPNLHNALKEALPAYKFDFDAAREEAERERLDMDAQNYELVCSGYFL